MRCWQRFKVALVVNCLELMISYYSAVLEQCNAVDLCCCECRVLCIYICGDSNIDQCTAAVNAGCCVYMWRQ